MNVIVQSLAVTEASLVLREAGDLENIDQETQQAYEPRDATTQDNHFVLKCFGIEVRPRRTNLFGFPPVVWGLRGSYLLAIAVSKTTDPAGNDLVQRYFYKQQPKED